jgi:hypothetical protein
MNIKEIKILYFPQPGDLICSNQTNAANISIGRVTGSETVLPQAGVTGMPPVEARALTTAIGSTVVIDGYT